MSRRTRFLVTITVAVLGVAVAGPGQARTYYGTVGSGGISVKNGSGVKVTRIPAGLHSFVVRDRSSVHNFHLSGYLVDRRTTVAFVGTRTWSVRVYRGRTYRYVCDPHRTHMRGSFSVY